MSATQRKHWLVAYDIRSPRRLQRVHRFLSSQGLPLQYSVFLVPASDGEIRDMLEQLAALIAADEDDVRAYHLPKHCPVWVLGKQGYPDGVIIDSAGIDRFFGSNTSTSPQGDLLSTPPATPSQETDFNRLQAKPIPRTKGD